MDPLSIVAAVDASSGFVVAFFALLIGHAVADFALQGEFLAVAKNRHAELSKFFGESPAPKGIWIYALGAHSLIHAGAVWLITGSVALGLLEFVLHWVIDFAKCEGWTGFKTDQFLHVACKIAYAVMITTNCPWIAWTP
ncbi:hypothetical protein HAHE_34440 [Haloferula helveola]|uniref:DUF3307 domain-containing protein n=1 Tax=Haloferula helveola TaxID=490095 RepID=A0ABN6H7D9_9BACT|nr:hypothetical protein HAHE_34440 [Haloferula helveola]